MKMDAATYENSLAHYGVLRRSGRYPYGSGAKPHQHAKAFLDILADHKKEGLSDAEIAKLYHTPEHPFKTHDLRALKSRAVNDLKREQIRVAQTLKDKGMGNSEIGKRMGVNESTVRSLLEPGRLEKLDILQSTAAMLKRQVEEKGMIDVGSSVNLDLPVGDNTNARIGISPDKFNTALALLKEEGYRVHTFKAPQVGTGEMTTYKVLVKPGVTQRDAWLNRNNIRLISEKSDDHGRTFSDTAFKPPLNISPKRVAVRYKEEGGADADGVIYVRPGVPDVTLGKSRYAQVRIAVGGTHYLKGMAVYKDDLPDGVDLMFNTNKSNTGNKLDAMKELKRDKETGEVDRDLPFGAVIKDGGQILGKNGKPKSVMNLINEEGDWDNWSRNLSSQVLSKQSPDLAKTQLDVTYERRRAEFEKIKALTNPKVKQKLLETFADESDAAAVHLKAANMPRQATKVLLPSNHVKDTEIFAPTFKDGERVALVRFPHAGLFEIPELTVNNKSREARKLLGIGKGGTAPDVVVINPKVAARLSGADFDGDAVVVIPNNRKSIQSEPALEGLKGFDPQKYAVPKEAGVPPTITATGKQQQMGLVTNLISDMTIRGASKDELARAVRHSMVVIDSEKHNLDYKASARENGINELKRKYQGVNEKTGQAAGASTLITRASSQTHPFKRKAAPSGDGLVRLSNSTVDPKTGKKVWVDTDERKPDGSRATFRSKKLAETDDAHTLVSEGRTRIELVYADHSNRLKSLANEARREWTQVKPTKYNESAKKVYKYEVASLDAKLRLAEKNAPLERQAQAVANRMVAQKRRANPDMQKDELKKIKGHALTEARLRTGAKKDRIEITDKEWDAIQAGAISNHKLERILNNSNLEAVRERATPRINPVMTPALTNRAKAMLNSGYTLDEVADHLGVALSTLKSGVE